MSKPFKRDAPSRNIGRKTLISCEGKKTEPIYFNAIRQDLKLSENLIIVIKHERTDPLGIVEEAIAARSEQKYNKEWDKEDSAWAVFDGDEHIESNFSNWKDAINTARLKTINLAITNPAIEFWFLLHFQDYSANINRTQARIRLKNYISKYDKNTCYYQSHLKSLTSNAINRAKEILVHSKNDHIEEFSNPCCKGISELVERLLDPKAKAKNRPQ